MLFFLLMTSRTMTFVKCSTKPGYCKHQHSSILHSSSSKGKLLALIECETNLSSLSLFLFLSPYSPWRYYITDDSRRARGFRKVASNVHSLRKDRTFPAADPRDNLIIPANIRVSATRENSKKFQAERANIPKENSTLPGVSPERAF